MASAVHFFVPGQPVAKGRARAAVRHGRVMHYTPAKTAAFESHVATLARCAMTRCGHAAPFDGACAMAVVQVFAVPKSWTKARQEQALAGRIRPTGRPDADNCLKAVSDGINGVVFVDDAQVVSLSYAKRYGAEPGTDVLVQPMLEEVE